MLSMNQLVTREGDLFQVSDRRGDFGPELPASGLYCRDTRVLSRFELLINGSRPEPLGASAAENYIQTVVTRMGSTLGLQRQRVIYAGVMYERITATNHGLAEAPVVLELRFDADFADLFEVRGYARARRGEIRRTGFTFRYTGLDGIIRVTDITFSPAPTAPAKWDLALPPGGTFTLDVTVNPTAAPPATFESATAALKADYDAWRAAAPAIDSDSEILNRVLDRSLSDLRLLLADIGHGPFPVAGIPWYAVPFGRDSILTAMLALPINPALARGTLRTLAALQGTEANGWRQEEPGKIPHELRFGEMANLDEIPFKRYYGTVDATPLFLVLIGQYYAWTGDLQLVRELLPAIKAALAWIGDGLLTFSADAGLGLHVQSWKDSHDSLTHRDGTPAASPVAVSEVQGYVYDAKRCLAPILAAAGEPNTEYLTREAEALKAEFNAKFWMEDRQFYAIAIDGAGRQVGTVSSDIGHALWSGIVQTENAAAVARQLAGPALFSGWGIRTLSVDESGYNPFSYHNGSVWPHDTAICILGLQRYGFDRAAARAVTGLVDAAAHFPYFRLPELFCGYGRDSGAPVSYPVACSPQAWAAAAPFALVQAMLGLSPDAAGGVLRIRPALPDWLGRLTVRGLKVGAAVVDLTVTRAGVQADVRAGNLRVVQDGSAVS